MTIFQDRNPVTFIDLLPEGASSVASPQSSFVFESAPEPNGEKSRAETEPATQRVTHWVLPTWATSIEDLLALAARTPGWNNRTAPPQFATHGCTLVVIPPHLWRSRTCARRAPACPPIPMRRQIA